MMIRTTTLQKTVHNRLIAPLIRFTACLVVLAGAADGALIGHWTFEEGAGSTAIDSAAVPHHGTLHGNPQYGPGKQGNYALEFDGSGDYVEIGLVPALDLTGGSYTIAFWASATGSGVQRFINKDEGNDFSGGYTVAAASGGLLVSHNNGSNRNLTVPAPDGTIDASWTHIAVVYDQGAGMRSIYRDGSLLTAHGISGGAVTESNDDPLLFGAIKLINGSISQFLTGRLDDVRIYDTALDASEVNQLEGGTYMPPILTMTRANESAFDISWPSQSNTFYNLWSSSDVSEELSNWDLAEGGIAATPPTNTVRVTPLAMVLKNYYRVGEQPPPLVIPDMVEVGNPGNLDDTADNGVAPGDHSGAVPYVYSIGKYEVTNGEYVEFLNAVDPNGVNATALYNSSMDSDNSNGGITFTAGNADGLKYAVKPGFAAKPVVYVSFYDAMRYCNWLHNGAQAGGDTENGAYTLVPPVDSATGAPTNGVSVVRNAGARFAVPTEDEWYKAAYHQPQASGGPADNYWLYPTPTGSFTGDDVTPPNAEGPPGTAPAANYLFNVRSVTDVGAYTTTPGYYGTFDMAGNVFEWIETRSGSSRVLRGGSWFNGEDFLLSDGPLTLTPVFELNSIGFRISSHPPPLVIPELVEVGNPGNLDDTADNGVAPGDHSGAVPYVYSIGKYEVTNGEYVEFLNAVDPNGVNGVDLYDFRMDSSSLGGITFTAGNGDGAKYALKPGFANKPVVLVSFYDAMRYCNWLHNGAQAGGDTENGAYTLLGGGATPTNGTTVERNAGAKFAVPTEDEWYKAAYHQPSGDGGPTDNYWLYPTPTGSLKGNNSTAPNASLPPGTPPAANYNGAVNTLTDVGAYSGTEGYYGTYDMAGNVYEWVETRSGSSRVLRGGSWGDGEDDLRSDFPDAGTPVVGSSSIGFRISSP